jgi:hypothetical protein
MYTYRATLQFDFKVEEKLKNIDQEDALSALAALPGAFGQMCEAKMQVGPYLDIEEIVE